MPIEYIEQLTRSIIQANPQKFYVFGDNVERKGRGGQASAARGEPNALGIATKWRPSMRPGSFFKDDNLAAWEELYADLYHVEFHLKNGNTVVVPNAGVGTGLSQLQVYAPKMLKAINLVLFPKALVPLTKQLSKPFVWRSSTGDIPINKMETSHVFNAFRMLWNHHMPKQAFVGHDYLPTYSSFPGMDEAYKKAALASLYDELCSRNDLKPRQRQQLDQMRAYFKPKLIAE